MSGVSGAFLLLPFQMSFLNFTSPSVSSTNFVFNIVAIPSGVYRYIKEKRMAWPLVWVIIIGTLPGVLFGYYIRALYMPDPGVFKFFVGCVLF
ncbi:MAG TPA: sulfite exporter TauE/SafE family protein, partial [Nitrospirae bacterium]|nr:sulfite exporter TauE/SafE family protein [Nitrospirota bacterium]